MATTKKSTAERIVEQRGNNDMKKVQIINLLALVLFAYMAIINLVKFSALKAANGIFGAILWECVFVALVFLALYALNKDILILNCAVDGLKSLTGRFFGDKESRRDSFVRDVKTAKKASPIVVDEIICECGAPIVVGKRFCSECGKPAPKPAPKEIICECGEPIPFGKRFCSECGKPAPKPVPKEITCECGEVVPAGKSFCPGCGKKVC